VHVQVAHRPGLAAQLAQQLECLPGGALQALRSAVVCERFMEQRLQPPRRCAQPVDSFLREAGAAQAHRLG
jgi:hypothetical protein